MVVDGGVGRGMYLGLGRARAGTEAREPRRLMLCLREPFRCMDMREE